MVISPGWRGGSIGIEGVQLFSKPLQPHEKLAHWYRGATALVFPSFHETFGFPIVEAMACGCPVITSDVTACPEIAGDAALCVNPHSVAEITEAMRRIQDAEVRGMLRARGLGRARLSPSGPPDATRRIYHAHIAEIARLAGARVVVTDDPRHFADLRPHGIRVMSTADFATAVRA